MKPDISIITFTLGNRNKYLAECCASVEFDLQNSNVNVEHHVVFQGCEESSNVLDGGVWENYEIVFHMWPENIGIGAGLNKILQECKGGLIFKMDDDCEVVSHSFFERALALHKKFPKDVFSPYPVGLIGNPGGPKGAKHSIWHNKLNDVVYTRRHVSHVGGFARFAPGALMRGFNFAPDLIPGISGTEDSQFSNHCNANGINMFYLENALIVEHQESTLGQIARFPEYFKNRTGEQSMKFEIVE